MPVQWGGAVRLTEEQYAALIGRNAKAKPANKFGAKHTNGYASKAEAMRAEELKLLQRAGKISDLQEQVKFPLLVDGELIGYYIADFMYVEDGEQIVEDVKGFKTPMFRWKAKHFRAQYGRSIKVTGKSPWRQ